MKKLLPILCIICALNDSVAQEGGFSWLVGTWKLEGHNAFEVWSRERSGQLSGESFRVEGADTIVTETISLKFLDGSFHYIPDVAGDQPPIDFPITFSDDYGFVAENQQHDFPKIIRYRLVIKDGSQYIDAAIEGNGKVILYSFRKL